MKHHPLFGAAALCAGLLAACAAPPTPAPATLAPATLAAATVTPTAITPASATPPPATLTPTPPPARFTLGLPAAPRLLDPALALDSASLLITRHLYEGLTGYAPNRTEVTPALAESWQTSPDGLTWTFTLRAGARFHDGTPLTADLAAQSLARQWNRTSPGDYAFWRTLFGGHAFQADQTGAPLSLVAGITATSELELVIGLHRPHAALAHTLAMPAFAIIHPAALANPTFGQLNNPANGTGPFTLAEWSTPDRVVLARNPNYWGTPAAPETLTFKAIPETTQRRLAFLLGEVDGFAAPDPADLPSLQAESRARLAYAPPNEVAYLGFNQAVPPWNDPACRAAVAQALNRDRYVPLFGPGAQRADSLLPAGVTGWEPQTWPAVGAANAAATCPTLPTTLTLTVPDAPRSYLPDPPGVAQAIAEDVAALGLTVNPVALAVPNFVAEVQSGRATWFVLGTQSLNGDPDDALCPMLCGFDARFNRDARGFAAPPAANLADLLRTAQTAPAADRPALYAEAQRLAAQQVVAVPLASPGTAWVLRADLTGAALGPLESVFTTLTWEAP